MKTSFSTLLLLQEPARFYSREIDAKIRAIGGAMIQSLTVEGGEGDAALIIELNGIKMAVMAIPQPAPGFSSYQSDGPNLLWPSVEADLARHNAHVSVVAGGEVEGRDLCIAFATAVTFVSAAILALSKPIGVYWPAGENFVTADTFIDAAEGFARGEGPPVLAWIRLYAGQDKDGIALSTHGLRPFAGRELDFAPSKRQLGELMQYALSISHYLVSSGTAFRDGETIGPDDQASFAIALRINGRMGVGPVYELAAPGARSSQMM